MPAVRLRPPGRDGPHTSVPVDLCLPHLAPARCRQHQELERQSDGRHRRRCPHRPDHLSYLSVRQGLHVLDNVMLGTQHRADPVACGGPYDASNLFIERFAKSLSNPLAPIFRAEQDGMGLIGVAVHGQTPSMAVADFAAQWCDGARFHGLTPTAICCRSYAAVYG